MRLCTILAARWHFNPSMASHPFLEHLYTSWFLVPELARLANLLSVPSDVTMVQGANRTSNNVEWAVLNLPT